VTSNITFNPDELLEAYNNPRITKYMAMTREVRGPDFDLVREPPDPEIVVKIGNGRRHGRYFVGDSLLVPSSALTLSHKLSPAHRTTTQRYGDHAGEFPGYVCYICPSLTFTCVCFVF
jgi:hypothetical protein